MRKAMLMVSAELFIEILKHPAQPGVVSEGLPPDSAIVAVDWGFPGVILLAVESNTFPEIQEGQKLPELRVLFRRQEMDKRPATKRPNGGKSRRNRHVN